PARVQRVSGRTAVEAPFNENLRDVEFRNDSQGLAIAGRGEIELWSVSPWKRLWRVPSPAPSSVGVIWSMDDSVLLADYRAMTTVLLDSATGHRLATIPVSKPSSVLPEDKVLPSFNAKISKRHTRWAPWSFRAPDGSPPRDSLARIPAAAGLELVGAELVDTLPGPAEH